MGVIMTAIRELMRAFVRHVTNDKRVQICERGVLRSAVWANQLRPNSCVMDKTMIDALADEGFLCVCGVRSGR